MTQTGKLMPNLDQQSTKLLNLTVLQRMDPYIEEILITAAHVTFYGFNIDLNQWSRKDVEGSLFVVKRNTQPRFQFIVMNRRNTENLVENLLGDFEYELQVPYLLYRNGAQEVNGIWFYNARECEDVANLFTRILSAYSKVPPKIKGSASKSEFEELEAVSTSGVIEGPPEPPFTPSSSTDAPEDSAFLNFFSTATNMGHNTPDVVISSAQPHHTSTTVPLSSRLPNVLSPAQTVQIPSLPLSVSSSNFTITPLQESSDTINNNRVTNLLKPSSFFMPAAAPISTPFSTSAPHPQLNLQRAQGYGTPILQPFPPPTPHISLTPSSASLPNYGTLNREKVRDALHMLVQDNQFIEMFYQALAKGHQS